MLLFQKAMNINANKKKAVELPQRNDICVVGSSSSMLHDRSMS